MNEGHSVLCNSDHPCDCPPIHEPGCINDPCEIISCDVCGGDVPECNIHTDAEDNVICQRCCPGKCEFEEKTA